MGDVIACQVCSSVSMLPLLDMGSQPLAESMGDNTAYPLVLMRCTRCQLVQLDYIVDQRKVFPLDHPYATGNTKALREHYMTLARELSWKTSPCKDRLAVDIGANDGTFLAYLRDLAGYDVLAVEPTNQARKARDKKIRVFQAFWSRKAAQEIGRTMGKAKLITAMNVLAHVPDPHDFMDGVTDLLGEDGLFLTENHDLASITEGLQIDTIYHEHLRYFSVASLSRLLAMHGLRVTSAEPISTHGGSLRVTARKETPGFARRAETAAVTLKALLHSLTQHGKVYGIGATTRATPLIHYTGIADYITCICETPSSQKIGHVLPGTQIPIVDEHFLIEDQPEYALLLAWHIASDLIPKLREAGYRGKFIIPLPDPWIADD
jgi:2-polyprenyl-3-methyl-5-hydroxy-6-metoxy-1,4-benzoquinol methylase